MSPAPALPPVFSGAAGPPPEPGRPRHHGAVVGPHLGGTAASSVLVAAVVEQHRRTTELHEEFLRQQGEFYDRLHCLLGVAQTSVPSPVTPAVVEDVLDPANETWLADHRPTWTVPVLPGMSIADRLARAASEHTGLDVVALRDVQIRRWLTVPGPVRLRTEVQGPPGEPLVTLSVWWEAKTSTLSRFVPVATGTVLLGDRPGQRPARFSPLADARPVPSPYETGEMFHGPSFQYLVTLRIGAVGATGVLDLDRGAVPRGVLHPGVLDAAMHTIPGLNLRQWAPQIDRGRFSFPHHIASLQVFEPLPDTGTLDVETRFRGFHDGNPDLPTVDLQLCRDERVLLDFRMVLILVPLGRLEQTPPDLVRAFSRDRAYIPDLLLSTADNGVTVLRADDVEAADVVPGTVAALYGLSLAGPGREHLAHIAAKEHVARCAAVHPCRVELGADLRTAWCADRPHEIHHLDLTCGRDAARVRDAAATTTRRAP